jgi:hypothetical protein
LKKYLDKLSAIVDIMGSQTRDETPIKVEVTFGGKIKAIVLTELDRERYSGGTPYGEAGVDDFGPEDEREEMHRGGAL